MQTSCVESTPTQCANNVGYVAAFDITQSGANSLKWATYVSGPDNPNTAVSTQLNSIAADAQNNVYLTGYTTDGLFPITTGAYASTCPLDGRSGSNFCDNSVFVSKLNSTGTAYAWSTFLAPTQGAASGANSNGIALDAQGKVYVYGDTGNLILPAVNPLTQYPNDWYQPYPFLTVLDPTGSNVIFSSQIAPNNYVGSMQNGLALDPSGNIYMVGNTQGGQTYNVGNTTLTSWPTTQGTYSSAQTGTGAIPFFAKIAALLNSTTTTLTATPTTAAAGQSVTFNITVAGTTQTTPAPTGTVTLTNTAVTPAVTLGTIDLSAGAGSFTTSSLMAGTYTVVATYSADTVYDVSTSSTVTVTIAAALPTPTVNLTVPSTGVSGGSVTLSASVTGSGAAPTGTVQFFDGTNSLNTATLSGGAASYATSSLAVGTHNITAQYSGDSNYGAAVSSAQTITISAPPADFAIGTSPSSASIATGGTTTTTITVTPSNGFASATSLTCSGLPANATCSFSPTSVTPSSGAVTSTLTISTNVSASASSTIVHADDGGVLAKLTAAGSGGALIALLFWPVALRRKSYSVWLRVVAITCFSLIAIQALTACGGSSKPPIGSGSVTPAGTSSIVITGTAGSTTHTTIFTLTVN